MESTPKGLEATHDVECQEVQDKGGAKVDYAQE